MSSTPSPCLPPSPLQSEKAKRYDRQLRLWGDHGQSALERANICLINASATGTEILKSLVLPGIGNFTILDPHSVSGEDAGNNFFLTADSIGQPRGEVATRLLLEMNHEVRGESRQESVEQVLDADPDFFANFSLVVACGLSEKSLLLLSAKLESSKIPLLVVRTSGFLGYIRLQLAEHLVVETHPDNAAPDLRLDQPWEALANWLDEEGERMNTMDLKDHGHTPYPVIMYRHLKEWLKNHDGSFPANYKEKKVFKEEMLKGMRKRENNPELYEDEENFEEAARAVNTVLVKSSIPSDTRDILNDPASENISASSANFWILAHSLREFVAKENRLPVSGVIPDMFSDSERYIKLQNIYIEKEKQDAEIIQRKVQQVLESLGRSAETISETEIRRFCREAKFLRVQRGSSLNDEFSSSNFNLNLDDPESDALYYLVLRAVDRYMTQFGTNPGLTETDIELDIGRLKTITTAMLSQMGLNTAPEGLDEHIHEVCRYGGAELHSVAAFLGGAVAHECIKLLTGQFVPLDNLVLYNAVTSNVSSFKVDN
eukprot:GFUD01043021.1.p1 GENE.GFUD01043021.1~~GFUD01043021.1.p1  ORF type:complete len:545 (-),score=151.32 GFUD01043021.1:255-1889(-)